MGLLSDLAVAFISVVVVLVGGGALLALLARRCWRRRLEREVEEYRGTLSMVGGPLDLEGCHRRQPDLPPPYSKTKPATSPSSLPPCPPVYSDLPPPSLLSYSALLTSLRQEVALQAPGALHLLHLLDTDPVALKEALLGGPAPGQVIENCR